MKIFSLLLTLIKAACNVPQNPTVAPAVSTIATPVSE
jgi:hypothetical protein